jgi:hypothetical protein
MGGHQGSNKHGINQRRLVLEAVGSLFANAIQKEVKRFTENKHL